jgi:hypothetical protein
MAEERVPHSFDQAKSDVWIESQGPDSLGKPSSEALGIEAPSRTCKSH